MLDTINDLKMQVQQLEQRIDDQKQSPIQQDETKDARTEVDMAVLKTIRQLQLNGILTTLTHRTCSLS